MRNIGIIVFLLGVLGLILPALLHFESNLTLSIGGGVMLAGVILYVYFTKKEMDNVQ